MWNKSNKILNLLMFTGSFLTYIVSLVTSDTSLGWLVASALSLYILINEWNEKKV